MIDNWVYWSTPGDSLSTIVVQELYIGYSMAKQKPEKISAASIKALLLDSGPAVRFVNLITLYRIVTFPLLIVLALLGKLQLFKWLLLASFFTDSIDGYLARKYKATSVLGAKLDSIGDDLTILAAIVGLVLTRWDFIKEQWLVFAILFVLFLVQLTMSLIRYRKMSSFHTYFAKTAAVVTGIFLLSVFFTGRIIYPLFFGAAIITALELIEESIIVAVLPTWKTDVKGLYWVLRDRK